MKKLRLIKPWRLRATRLKLTDARWGGESSFTRLATCAAPGDTEAEDIAEPTRFAGHNLRVSNCMAAELQAVCTHAPAGTHTDMRGFSSRSIR